MVEPQTLISAGTVLMATGPSSVMLLLFVLPRPNLLVVSVIASFWWAFSMILASAWWWMIPPLREIYGWVLFSTVTIQELFRWCYFLALQRLVTFGDDLKCFVRTGKKAAVMQGIAVGSAYGAMSALVNYVAYLQDFYKEDSSVYLPICPINFWVVSAAFAMSFSILHIVLAVIAWQAYSLMKGAMKWSTISLVYLLHLGFSLLGLGNLNQNGCVWALATNWGVLGLTSAIAAFFTIRNLTKSD